MIIFLLNTYEIIVTPTGKKNDIGKTILSGNLKKMVIETTNAQLNNNEINDQNTNLTAIFLFFSIRKNVIKKSTIKRDEYIKL